MFACDGRGSSFGYRGRNESPRIARHIVKIIGHPSLRSLYVTRKCFAITETSVQLSMKTIENTFYCEEGMKNGGKTWQFSIFKMASSQVPKIPYKFRQSFSVIFYHTFLGFGMVLPDACSANVGELICGSSGNDPGTLRMGIVLITHGNTPNDYEILGPAIDLAIQRVKWDFNLTLEPVLNLYESACLEDGLTGLSHVVRALNQCIDVMVGPACTGDLWVAAKLATIHRVPLMTGAGSLLDMADAWWSATRTGYNIGTQWTFFVWICQQFGWNNVAVWYESDGIAYALNGQCKQQRYHGT